MNADIRSPPLSELVREEIKRQLVSGELTPGAPINEKTFARELGVSRSPLREALIRLESEALITHVPGKGFSVSSLEPEEAKDLYRLVGELESLAIRSEWEPGESTFASLTELNEARCSASTAREIVRIDTEWHDILVRRCRNEKLQETIAGLKSQLYRYEQKFIREKDDDREPVREHAEIVALLEAGDVDQAANVMRQHWLRGVSKVAENL